MSAEPTVTCTTCGRVLIVRPDGRGFPPSIAKRRLSNLCRADGHVAIPVYRAGISPALDAIIRAPEQGQP